MLRVSEKDKRLVTLLYNFISSNKNGSIGSNGFRVNGTGSANPFLTTPLFYPFDSQSHLSNHPFAHLISNEANLTPSDCQTIIDKVNFNLIFPSNGVIPASTNTTSNYSKYAWVRDMVFFASIMYLLEEYEEAAKVLKNLATFYNRQEERKLFTNFHWDPNPKGKYLDAPNNEVPQIRTEITNDGNMIESQEGWQHKQLDAIGMWLFLTFKMANEGYLDLVELDKSLSNKTNDSIFSVALTFLNRINYWDQFDVGPWEDYLGYKRASSIGICLGAFKKAYEYFENNNWDSIKLWSQSHVQSEIEHGIINGQFALNSRIPEEGEAIETDTFPFQKYDAALIFLLYPFNPGLSRKQEDSILRTIYKHRLGTVGISRRDNDNYVGMDYPYNLHSQGIYSHITDLDYKAAEWTLFDPLIAAYFFKRFTDSKGEDKESYSLAEYHFKRALVQVTKESDKYTKTFYENGQKREVNVEVPGLVIPEAYWYDSHEERWRPNENSPLLMSEAAFAMMIIEEFIASSLRENPNY